MQEQIDQKGINLTRSDVRPMPEYFDRYIDLVPDISVIKALENGLNEIKNTDISNMEKIGYRSYAPGKWTVKEIFQHLVDVERLLTYRTLLISRNDQSITASFDEKFISINSKANNRKLSDIISEYQITRQSTIALFASFDEEMMLRKGVSWKYEISVLALGFCIAGHQLWHEAVLKNKYL